GRSGSAGAPPQAVGVIGKPRRVGPPPLKILDGLTWPKPSPWANRPAGRPSVGTAACCWPGLLAQPAQISTTAAPSQRPPPRIAPTAPPFRCNRPSSPPARRADLSL